MMSTLYTVKKKNIYIYIKTSDRNFKAKLPSAVFPRRQARQRKSLKILFLKVFKNVLTSVFSCFHQCLRCFTHCNAFARELRNMNSPVSNLIMQRHNYLCEFWCVLIFFWGGGASACRKKPRCNKRPK